MSTPVFPRIPRPLGSTPIPPRIPRRDLLDSKSPDTMHHTASNYIHEHAMAAERSNACAGGLPNVVARRHLRSPNPWQEAYVNRSQSATNASLACELTGSQSDLSLRFRPGMVQTELISSHVPRTLLRAKPGFAPGTAGPGAPSLNAGRSNNLTGFVRVPSDEGVSSNGRPDEYCRNGSSNPLPRDHLRLTDLERVPLSTAHSAEQQRPRDKTRGRSKRRSQSAAGPHVRKRRHVSVRSRSTSRSSSVELPRKRKHKRKRSRSISSSEDELPRPGGDESNAKGRFDLLLESLTAFGSNNSFKPFSGSQGGAEFRQFSVPV